MKSSFSGKFVKVNMDDPYDADYFLRGRETGKSLYENYRWMPDLTIPMVQAIVNHLSIQKGESVLDFGCARGYVVRALIGLGYDASGIDCSGWAIENCDPAVVGRVRQALLPDKFGCDWIIAKDVLEHIAPGDRLTTTVTSLVRAARKGIFVVVPLGYGQDGYVVPEYEKDVTHKVRWRLATWAEVFMRTGWSVEARYRLRGVKDNYATWPHGNGFITARRIEE